MPELPEVETIIRDLKKIIPGREIKDVWADFKKMVKKPESFELFRKEIKNKKVLNVRRRGKNILFDLSGDKTLLIHQKLTGHLLIGRWLLDKGCWKPKEKGPLEEKINQYIHLMFWLDNNDMLALSDLRKFAKVEIWDSEELRESKEFKNLGPEPLEKTFTFKRFKEAVKKRGARAKIKEVLMDQEAIAGIGNIYSDEILFEAKINPFKKNFELSEKELKETYKAIKKILTIAIKLQGESISDFRRISGERGGFDEYRKVYKKEGESCPRCGAKIKRAKLGGRSAHFCPKCQES